MVMGFVFSWPLAPIFLPFSESKECKRALDVLTSKKFDFYDAIFLLTAVVGETMLL